MVFPTGNFDHVDEACRHVGLAIAVGTPGENLFADVRYPVLVVVGEGTVEDLAIVDDAVAVAVGGPFDDEA